MTACDDCLRRTALIAELAGWIELEWRKRSGGPRVLALGDDELLDACASARVRSAYAGFSAAGARARTRAAGLDALCRCAERYPALLRELEDPPAVLHVRGDASALVMRDGVAIVGSRRPSDYGLEVARALGRDLAVAGVPVVSGLAVGIDAAAHAGAVDAPGARPVAVLGNGADAAYPRSSRRLYDRIAERGAVVSELPPGAPVRRWVFPARNRIIAALARATVVVEAAERSGSLITADFAADLGRAVGAVPGRVTAFNAAGSNGLLASGAAVIRDARDVLDLLADFGVERLAPEARARPDEPHLRRLLEAVENGSATPAQLVRSPEEVDAVLRGLTELEARGLVRRAFGGRYVRTA